MTRIHCLKHVQCRFIANFTNDNSIGAHTKGIYDEIPKDLLTLAEDTLVMWAVDHPAIPGLMEVSVIPEAKRNPVCPVKYKMGIREELFGGLPGATQRSPDAAGGPHPART